MTQRTCTIDGCDRPSSSRGWCATHYTRWQRHGDPHHGGPIRRKLRTELSGAPFDQRTERRGDCLIWTGPVSADGYGRATFEGQQIPAHRHAWEQAHGPAPVGKYVDHRYHCDRRCCEITHLRLATRSENGSNRSGAPAGRARKLPRNVYYRVKGGTFFVRVMKDWKEYSFGTYKTVEEAAQVAERARQELFGEFAGRG